MVILKDLNLEMNQQIIENTLSKIEQPITEEIEKVWKIFNNKCRIWSMWDNLRYRKLNTLAKQSTKI